VGYSSVRSHGRYRVVEVFSVRNEDGSSGSLSLLHGLCYVLEDGQSKVFSARLLGVCASNNLCACRPVSPPPHRFMSSVSMGAYRIQSPVVRGSCSCISISFPCRIFHSHSRSLLSSEALEQDLGVAVDAKVLNRLGILRGSGRILPGSGLGERGAHRLPDCLHRDGYGGHESNSGVFGGYRGSV
jgi:hypothetical protein